MTQFNVAQFPWDPKPEPEAAASNGTPAASSGKAGASSANKAASPPPSADNSFSQPTMSPMASSQGLALPSLPMPAFEPSSIKTEDSTQSSGSHRIKMEPDTQNGSGLAGVPSAAGSQMPLPNAPPFPSAAGGPDSAAMRAAAMLSKEFGSAANASINAMNTQQQQQRPAGGQPSNAQQYRAQMSAQAAAQLNGANGVARSQVDGSAGNGSLFEGVLLQQQRAGQPPVELGRIEIDDLLHEQMARRAKQMEGGGLMLPLQQASQARNQKRDRKRRAAAAATAFASTSETTATSSLPRAVTSIAQLDGVDDDDEDVKADILDDEDAINSDLDDPEDDREDDDDDDDVMGPIMLCVYDKVQRVKNKWCVSSLLPYVTIFSST